MIVACPTCGAEVEFRYDDSFVRVCNHCRSAVVRTDRGAETLGRFADLIPIESPLRLFAEGRYGTTGFLLIGMAQLRHAAGGIWQEWYAKLDGGAWAWISEAQGRLYLTFERTDVPVPSIAAMAPGVQGQLAGAAFTVAERGSATYVSALGEIPYRLVPGSSFQFVDLSDGRGGFATIDYGDGSEPPAVYLGYQVTPQGLGISGGEAPRLATPVAAARLACPNCNGSLELRAPDQTLRVACPYCGSLVSVESGTLSIIARQAKRPTPVFPLGSKGKFADGELTVIGYMTRSAYLDGSWWPFEEYLLYAPSVGFRWLACSDGHWSYVQPIATGAVTVAYHASYDGVAFRRFQHAELRVDAVLGEFYWRVQAGERVRGEDYIAPPAMVSREATGSEQNWSLSTYLTPQDVNTAFGTRAKLPPPIGVGANQPYSAGVGKVMTLAIAALCAVGLTKCVTAPRTEKLRQQFTVPMAGTRAPAESTSDADPATSVVFSEKFQLIGGKNIRFDLSANLDNNWVFAVVDLINDDTGSVVSFDKSLEYYSGYDSDGSWSEGSRHDDEVVAPVDAGTYLLRIEGQHGGAGNVELAVLVRQGVFRWPWFWVALGVLTGPYLLVLWHAYRFSRKRWSNSNASATATTAAADDNDNDDDGDDDD